MNQLYDDLLRENEPLENETEHLVSGILGSSVLLLLMSVTEKLFLGSGYYATLVQHPFWIVVLLASVVSGLYVGVATAALAALMMDWAPRPIGVDITEHYIQTVLLPLQWLLAALCVGIFRELGIKEVKALRVENLHLRRVNQTLGDECARLDSLLEQAELWALTGSSTSNNAKEALKAVLALQDAQPDNLMDRFHAAAARLTGVGAELLLARSGDATVFAAANPTCGRFPPINAEDVLVAELCEAGTAIVVPAQRLVEGSPDQLVLAPVQASPGPALCGIVVLPCNEEVEVCAAAAELLARSVAAALARDGGGLLPAPDSGS